jgi:hypothetical protein
MNLAPLPSNLKACREQMISAGWERESINNQIGRIRRMFRWGTENELVSATVYQALETVAGLRKGRTEAVETDPVKPVADHLVEAIRPFVSQQVWAMVELQQLTAMRPGEVAIMRTADINMGGNVWIYVPESHKTEHHDIGREIYLGPQAQAIIKPFLSANRSAYLFSPRDAEAKRRETQRKNRRSPVQPSQVDRSRPKGQATLEHCVERYLGLVLSKDVRNSEGLEVRTSYGQYLGRSPQEIESIYLEYLAKDTVATFGIYKKLQEHLLEMLRASQLVWGFVSSEWLNTQVRRWGLQTHHIQLKAAIVLRAITANGLGIDLERRDDVLQRLDGVLDELRAGLRHHGYLPGQKGSGKALQEILRRLERQHPQQDFPRTPTGLYAKKRESLLEVAEC